MSDNRTAEEFLKDVLGLKYTLSIQMGADIKLTPTEITYMVKEHASQQTASLREENEKLKADVVWYKSIANNDEPRDAYRKRISELQEEVEQLRGRQKEFGRWLMNIGISGRTFEQLWSEFDALSSKESKPS